MVVTLVKHLADNACAYGNGHSYRLPYSSPAYSHIATLVRAELRRRQQDQVPSMAIRLQVAVRAKVVNEVVDKCKLHIRLDLFGLVAFTVAVNVKATRPSKTSRIWWLSLRSWQGDTMGREL